MTSESPDGRRFALVRDRLGTGLDDDDARYLLDQMRPVEGDAGVRLIVRGETNDRLFLLLEGTLAAIVAGEDELVLGRMAPGAWIGEASFIDPGRRARPSSPKRGSKRSR